MDATLISTYRMLLDQRYQGGVTIGLIAFPIVAMAVQPTRYRKHWPGIPRYLLGVRNRWVASELHERPATLRKAKPVGLHVHGAEPGRQAANGGIRAGYLRLFGPTARSTTTRLRGSGHLLGRYWQLLRRVRVLDFSGAAAAPNVVLS